MTREQIAGFMLGLSVGTAVGYYLRPAEEQGLRQDNSEDQRQVPAARTSVRIWDTRKPPDQRKEAGIKFG